MKFLNIFKERYFQLLFAVVLISSFFTYRYLLLHTTFGYDMARDAFHAYDILFNQNFKIIGPGTDIPGLNHGVFWFYFLVIPYFFAQQDPQVAVIFFFILSIATIPFVWLLSQKLFNNRRLSFVAITLYCFSPLVIPFASWMSNPILCLYITPVLLLLILNYSEKQNKIKALLIGLLFGLMAQSQLANLILFIAIPIYYFFLRIKFRIWEILTFFGGLLIALSSFILVEIKFNGRGINALLNYLNEDHGGKIPDSEFITDKFIDFLNYAIFPYPKPLVISIIILIVVGIIFSFKNYKRSLTFLLIWLSNILIFAMFDTGVSRSLFVYVPSIAAGIILVSFLLTKYIKSALLLGVIVTIIVIFQLNTIEKWNRTEFSPVAVQKSNTARIYKNVVDYTYSTSNGEPFTIVTVTNPLFINTVWEYLYEFHGNRKYGYKPFFGGRSQVGYQYTLENKPFGTDTRFLIFESSIGLASIYLIKAQYEEDKVSDLVEEKKFGEVVVQKRIFNENKEEIEIPQKLRESHVLYE